MRALTSLTDALRRIPHCAGCASIRANPSCCPRASMRASRVAARLRLPMVFVLHCQPPERDRRGGARRPAQQLRASGCHPAQSVRAAARASTTTRTCLPTVASAVRRGRPAVLPARPGPRARRRAFRCSGRSGARVWRVSWPRACPAIWSLAWSVRCTAHRPKSPCRQISAFN